jgi:hypothetical protein
MGKDKSDGLEEFVEVLIQFEIKDPNNIDTLLKRIEGAQGEILHVYPPYLIIARIPEAFINVLKTDPAVHSVDTDEIRADRLEASLANLQLAFLAWNEYLRNKSIEASTQTRPLVNWDAPGRLPPDPPPHMREILRKREEELKKGDSNLP